MKRSLSTKTRVIAFVLLTALFTGSASTAYAFIPGESAVIVSTMWQIHAVEEKTKWEQFLEKVAQLKAQIDLARSEAKYYRAATTGSWTDPMQVLRDENSRLIALGIDLRNIGWQPGNETANAPVLQRAENAIRYMDAATRGEQAANGRQLRDSFEDLYEVSNATRTGGRSEAAYHEMATAVATMGELSKQIERQNQIYDEAYELTQKGGLAADEVRRLGVLMTIANGRSETLKTQLGIQQTRLQMQDLGIKVAQANERDRELLDDRAKRVSAMNAFQLGPGQPTIGQLDREQ